LPATGVYYTTVEYKGNLYKGITSVGYNPTVEAQALKLTVETYILDFNENIYNEDLKVYFIHRIRDELKFDSLNALVLQLRQDRLYAENQILEYFT
jgi:riboflavin kinase/FMN adenylyltransferase